MSCDVLAYLISPQMEHTMTLHKSSGGLKWLPEDRHCPVCASSKRKTLGRRGGNAHYQSKGVETSIVQCLTCDLVYAYPTLVPQSNPYELETAQQYFGLHDFDEKVLKGEALADFAAAALGRTGEMLELGCGRGEFLIGAGKKGWKVKGVEMTGDYAQDARSHGIEVESSPIQECEALGQMYDVILLIAVLEHVYDPLGTLRQINKALRPGGLLFVDVPNEFSLAMSLGNLYMKLQGRDWVVNLSPTFPPYHVVGFSALSLRNTLLRAGLQIHTMYRPKRNEILPKGDTIRRRVELLSLRCVTHIGRLIGMGDGIECWAIKPKADNA